MGNVLGVGVPELVILGVVLGPVVLLVVLVSRRAKRFGYASAVAYLRASPRSDAEKRDAADLALKGMVFCALGLLFAPLILLGLIPLFYGLRKLVYASMGLDLVDDQDEPSA